MSSGPDIAPHEADSDQRTGSRLDLLVRLVCPYDRMLVILFSVLTIFTLVSLASVAALGPGNPSYYIAVMTAVMDGTLVIVLAGLLYLCRQYNKAG